jgi:hypothetical protein
MKVTKSFNFLTFNGQCEKFLGRKFVIAKKKNKIEYKTMTKGDVNTTNMKRI